MPAEKTLPPLSSTVSTVFGKFIERLKEKEVLSEGAAAALSKTLTEQKFGHEALRSAIFTTGKTEE